MMDFTKEVTKHMDKGMSQQEAYAQLFYRCLKTYAS